MKNSKMFKILKYFIPTPILTHQILLNLIKKLFLLIQEILILNRNISFNQKLQQKTIILFKT